MSETVEEPRKRKSRVEVIADTRAEIERARARLKSLEAAEEKKVRREMDHAKIVIGVAVLTAIERGKMSSANALKELLPLVSRDSDRAAIMRGIAWASSRTPAAAHQGAGGESELTSSQNA